MFRSMIPFSLLVLLNGCAYWPAQGHGGQAESFETEPAYWSSLRKENKAQIECFDRLIQEMTLNSVSQTHPAKLKELTVLWTRAIRAHAGHLDLETHNDLSALQEGFRLLSKDLRAKQNFQLVSTSYSVKGACK